MVRGILILVFVLAGLAVAGCGGAAPILKTRGIQPVAWAENQKTPVAVTAKFAEELVFTLPPIEQRGYRWQVFWHDPRYLKQLDEIKSDGPERPFIARFQAVRSTNGRGTRMRFLAIREGAAKEDLPIAMCEASVTVQDLNEEETLAPGPAPEAAAATGATATAPATSTSTPPATPATAP